MKLGLKLSSMFLELVWSKFINLQYPINYSMKTTDGCRVVRKKLMVGGVCQDFIFISQQISYLRSGKFFRRKTRLYRVEVIEGDVDQASTYESKTYLIPELCGSIFKSTLIPHSCAINFVISRITSDK